MIIIADSGSTKTDWCLIQVNGEIKTVQTVGLNPYFMEEEAILNILKKDLYPYLDNKKVVEVYFYGSGCASENKQQVLQSALDAFFMHAQVEVHSDLLGAAKALFGNQKGIVCIFGTGSSSCVYDGNAIIERMPSLGYVLGDEGSGAVIGKMLLSKYLNNELPQPLHDAFQQAYPMNMSEILDKIYHKPFPNKFLASFTYFVAAHKADSCMQLLLEEAFDNFFEKNIVKYNNYQEYSVGVAGSIGYIFADEIKKSAAKYAVNIEKIEQTPISGLLKYYSKN